jgi:isocitrate dehydrogenase kinase/phosphatase
MIRLAPGIKGLVMVVFTLPSYPYVFKIIKDRFPAPKDTSREKVVSQYRLVKSLDRVGRMADTWEFSHVAFPANRFDQSLLDELEREASAQVVYEGDSIIFRHMFIEHRMTPLNMYLDDPQATMKSQMLREYGQAIKDISSSGIFPGDLLTKNFGITGHGRVIFYDYDEIIPLDQCNFRKIPLPRFPEDELASTPWYSVGPMDIFPEEFITFLVTRPEYRKTLRKYHPDLFQAEYWISLQKAVENGFFPDIFPYSQEIRFST